MHDHEEQLDVFYSIFSKMLRRFDKTKKVGAILDVGSNEGALATRLARHAKTVWGVDIYPELIKTSRKQAKIAKLDNTKFKIGFAENLPFDDGSFDIITATSVLEHVENVNKSIDEMVRVLKPGGLLCIDVPNYFWIREAHYHYFMWPLMPKWIFYLVLKLTRHPQPNYVFTLNYTTVGWLTHQLKKRNIAIYNYSLDLLKQYLNDPQMIPEYWSFIRKILTFMRFLGLHHLIYALVSRIHFYPGIVLFCTKP